MNHSLGWLPFFEVENFLARNPRIREVPGENTFGKFIFESVHNYPVLNDLEVLLNERLQHNLSMC